MRYFLLFSTHCNYFLLRLTTPHPENAVVEAIRVEYSTWAEQQGVLTCLEVKPTENDLLAVLAPSLYLRVSAWPKYYFPTFFPATPNQDYTYQWYGIEDMQEMLELVKQCLALADKEGGVRVGIR